MNIKIILLSFVLFLANIELHAQLTFHAYYKFEEVNSNINEPRQYNASILKNKEYILYTHKVAPSQKEKENLSNPTMLFDDYDFEYKIFMTQDKFYTHDLFKGKDYYFEEEIPEITYEFIDETKEFWNKTAHKATTHFRGRDFVIWYEKSDVHISPWKFVGIPGVVLEAYSTDNNFRWSLERIDTEMKKIKSPFAENLEFLSCKEYSRLTAKDKDQLEINIECKD